MENREEKTTLFFILFLVVSLGVIHLGALEYYFYWTYAWLDIVTHTIGGIIISLLALLLYQDFNKRRKNKNLKLKNILLVSIVSVLFISFFWEIFELSIWESLGEPNYFRDTVSDTISALIGALIGYTYFVRRFNLEKNNEK